MAPLPTVLRRPPRHPRAAVRPRVSSWSGDEVALVLVAPAGSGKSVAALHAAEAHGGRLRWCRLAPGYGAPADLVTLAGGDASTSELVDLAGALLEVLEREPSVLVVDDYHHAEPDCDVVLAEVISLLAPECRVVLAGRWRPAGLLGRVPGGLVRVVDEHELAFTVAEAEPLLGSTADRWVTATGGWPAAVGMVADGASDATPDALVEALVLPRLDERGRRALGALGVLPYLTPDLAALLDVGDGALLAALGEITGLVVESDGYWRLHDVARASAAATITEDDRQRLRVAAARELVATDPTAAIDLLLDAGHAEEAADVLVRRAGEVGESRAVRWAYRMPAAVRRRLPPHLTASRATVDVDVATEAARARIDAATGDDERADALLDLGTALLAGGDLAGAADALEQVATSGSGRRRERASAWLAAARWWLGDLAGADAALDGAGTGVLSHWVRAHVALAGGRIDEAERAARAAIDAESGDDLTVAAGESVVAIVAALRGDDVGSRQAAGRAFDAGRAAGGFDLVCGAVAAAWSGLDVDGAIAALDSKIVRQDAHARLHLALLQLAAATDTESRERAARRVRDLRQAGFAPVEALAHRLLSLGPNADDVHAAGLRIELRDDLRITVDGEPRSVAWRSRKALETLLFLAVAGERGARRETVIEAIWPEREPEKGRTLLRTALSEIRRVLEPGRPAGEPSRFLVTAGERVAVAATTDVDGDSLDPVAEVDGAGEWLDDVRRDVQRRRLELAERIAASGDGDVVRALEVLIDAEPWKRDHFDALAAHHRAAGDEVAARAVERRWFEDEP